MRQRPESSQSQDGVIAYMAVAINSTAIILSIIGIGADLLQYKSAGVRMGVIALTFACLVFGGVLRLALLYHKRKSARFAMGGDDPSIMVNNHPPAFADLREESGIIPAPTGTGLAKRGAGIFCYILSLATFLLALAGGVVFIPLLIWMGIHSDRSGLPLLVGSLGLLIAGVPVAKFLDLLSNRIESGRWIYTGD